MPAFGRRAFNVNTFMRAGSTHEGEDVFHHDPSDRYVQQRQLPALPELDLLRSLIDQAEKDLHWLHHRPEHARFCLRDCIPCAARRWIADEQDAPFTFSWCCGMLELDVGALRARLLTTAAGCGTRRE